MTLEKEIEKSMRYREWYREIVYKNVSFDIQGYLKEAMKNLFETFKGMVVEIGSFEKEIYDSIRDAIGMKCRYHIDVEMPRKRDRRESMINEKIKIIYENNAGDTIVCGDKETNDPAFYDEAKYIIEVILKRILIEIEDELYIMPIQVKNISVRSL